MLPLLVFCAAPAHGHTNPVLRVAKTLIGNGYEAIFMNSIEFKAAIEKIGASFHKTSEFFPEGAQEAMLQQPPGLPTLLWTLATVFLGELPRRSSDLKTLLESIRAKDPSREVIIINETVSMAVLPFMYGAPLPKGYTTFPKVINLNPAPLLLSSIDTAPFGTGLAPDSTEAGRARNALLNQMMVMGPFKPVIDVQQKILASVGVPEERLPTGNILDRWFDAYDTTFQLCSPSLEYPRSDLHPSIRFSGCLPPAGLDPDFAYPSWWKIITDNAALAVDDPKRKKLIPVAQGTVATQWDQLLIPTIKALAKREDVILLVILCVKGGKLPEDLEIPDNTLVIDHLPYDAALQYADVFISNGGYGGILHGVINGVPMVVSGTTETKVEETARAEYAGYAINLRTQTPTGEQIYSAVNKVLSEPKYKHKAVRLMWENRDMDCESIIQREIQRYTA